jgi:hypothetical protein
VYVMLTVDLNNYVTEEQREVFGDRLQELLWNRISLTTTWWAEFNDDAEEDEMIRVTIDEVADAAARAQIASYEVAAQAGQEAPTIHTVRQGLRGRPR